MKRREEEEEEEEGEEEQEEEGHIFILNRLELHRMYDIVSNNGMYIRFLVNSFL